MTSDRPDFYDLIARNRRRTWLLMAAFFLLLAVVGLFISLALGGGLPGAIVAVLGAFGLTFFSYRSSAGVALRATRAVPADPSEFAQLHNLVESMAIAAAIPKPAVYVVHDPAPNAFATGRTPETAAVAATTGLLEKMDRDELEGVMAHEIAHIRNGDIRVMTVAVATAGAIALIADVFFRIVYWNVLFGGGRRRNDRNSGGPNAILILAAVVLAILAPLAASLLRAAVSRSREALADATAVEITRYPAGLRSALEKLDQDVTVVQHTSHATSHLWIESPDDHENKQSGRWVNDLFSTHPPLSDRINLLRTMEGLPPYPAS